MKGETVTKARCQAQKAMSPSAARGLACRSQSRWVMGALFRSRRKCSRAAYAGILTRRLLSAKWTICLVLLGLITVSAHPSGSAPLADAILVRLHPSRGPKEGVEPWAAKRGLSVERRLRIPGTFVMKPRSPVQAVLAELGKDPNVLYAQRMRLLEPCATIPNDPLFGLQWQLRNTGQSGGTPGADIRATEAWDVTTGSLHAVIAIVDSGLELGHPDLAARVWTNPGEIAGNGNDDDGNGYVDDVHGWNFYGGNNDVSPTLSHGTNVAGLAGPATDNGIGVAGVDWNARLMIVNIFSPQGYATEADAADALVYAADNGAQVINASWGSPGYSPVLHDAIQYVRNKGAFICVAAGNYNFDSDAHPFYPACVGSDAVLAIGGSTNRDAWVFNYGGRKVHLSAPASLVYQARYPSTYGYGSGTSYAAPLVSGVAALLWGLNPDVDPVSLKFRLMATAAPRPGLSGRSVTEGRLDAAAAVTAYPDPSATTGQVDIDWLKVGCHGVIVRLRATGLREDEKPSFYQVKWSTDSVTTASFLSLDEQWCGRVPPSGEAIVVLQGMEPGTTYELAARLYNKAGIGGPLTVVPVATLQPERTFFDACDTTSPVWEASGFVLAGGGSHTGALSWQDSPDGEYTSGTLATLMGGPFDVSSLLRPRLSFYLEYFFPSRLGEGDRLEVLASPDGGATWKQLQRFRATRSPSTRFSLPLDELGPTSNLKVQFRFVSDGNQFVEDGVYLDDIAIEEGARDVPFSDDVIVESIDFLGDETASPAFTRTAAWSVDASKSSAPRLAGSAAFSASAGGADAIATFVPFLPMGGSYDVLITHGGNANANGVTVTVRHAEGESAFSLNQTAANAHEWIALGSFSFDYGRNPERGSVTIDARAATGTRAFADAVRFVLREPQQESSSVDEWWFFE